MATKKSTVTHVPYGPKGLQHFPEDTRDHTNAKYNFETRSYDVPPVRIEPEWRPNEPFPATLTLDGTARGRSAAYFRWTGESGAEYPMFISDLADVLASNVTAVRAGSVTAWWMVAKRGSNYGLRLATPAELADHADDRAATGPWHTLTRRPLAATGPDGDPCLGVHIEHPAACDALPYGIRCAVDAHLAAVPLHGTAAEAPGTYRVRARHNGAAAPHDLPEALDIEPADHQADGQPHPTLTTRPDEDPTTR